MTMFNFKQLITAALLMSIAFAAQAERLKDIASISGVRSNQLIGYGLVVGLNGTGDQTTQTPFTLQTFNKDRKSTRLNSSHLKLSRMPSSA